MPREKHDDNLFGDEFAYTYVVSLSHTKTLVSSGTGCEISCFFSFLIFTKFCGEKLKRFFGLIAARKYLCCCCCTTGHHNNRSKINFHVWRGGGREVESRWWTHYYHCLTQVHIFRRRLSTPNYDSVESNGIHRTNIAAYRSTMSSPSVKFHIPKLVPLHLTWVHTQTPTHHSPHATHTHTHLTFNQRQWW